MEHTTVLTSVVESKHTDGQIICDGHSVTDRPRSCHNEVVRGK